MKKFLLFGVVFFSFFATQISAYEIHFLNPTNGQIFICGSDNTASVNVQWSSSGQKTGAYYYYTRLFTDIGDYNSRFGNTIPQWLYPGVGSHSWRIELWEGNASYEEYKVAEQTITFYAKYTLYAANNFGAGGINLEGVTVQSGSSTFKMAGETVAVGAIDQNYSSYWRIWNTNGSNNSNWKIRGAYISGATTRNYSYTVTSSDNLATIEADLKKLYNTTFNGYSSITVNGTTYSSPTSNSVVEQNSITASAQTYTVSNVSFNFESWKRSDGTTFPSTFTPTDHSTYNAVYRAKPSNSGENPHNTSAVGQPITIAWTDNANTNVTLYKIYRKVKHDGVVGPEQLIGTVNRGVQSYTDYDYYKTSTYVDLIWYDVRGYYNSTDPYIISDYQDPNYIAVYGEMLARPNQDPLVQETTSELPTKYAIANYPNPFNPTTTIKYQLPEAGMVTLKVYDILGKEVAELVNETKAAGYYEVNFNVKTHYGASLPSGVYIYTIRAGNYVESKKMILTK
ncbi:MAG: T9SS type A sorting domain-containing protein [Bacteroidota bacterium]